MRKFMMTSALVMPLMIAPAFAQETQPADQTEGDTFEQEAPLPEAGAEGGDALADDPMADDPLAGDETLADEDPLAAGEGEVADDPLAEPGDGDMAGDDAAAGTSEALVTQQAPSELRGDWITGTTIISPQDETIGQIQDLIIDEEEGRITAAIVSVGGFLGFGGKNIAVDWNELQINHDAQEITLDLTREEADAAPDYEFRERAEAPQPMGDMGGGDTMGEPAPAPVE